MIDCKASQSVFLIDFERNRFVHDLAILMWSDPLFDYKIFVSWKSCSSFIPKFKLWILIGNLFDKEIGIGNTNFVFKT